jgi:hypothetical protein
MELQKSVATATSVGSGEAVGPPLDELKQTVSTISDDATMADAVMARASET